MFFCQEGVDIYFCQEEYPTLSVVDGINPLRSQDLLRGRVPTSNPQIAAVHQRIGQQAGHAALRQAEARSEESSYSVRSSIQLVRQGSHLAIQQLWRLAVAPYRTALRRGSEPKPRLFVSLVHSAHPPLVQLKIVCYNTGVFVSPGRCVRATGAFFISSSGR